MIYPYSSNNRKKHHKVSDSSHTQTVCGINSKTIKIVPVPNQAETCEVQNQYKKSHSSRLNSQNFVRSSDDRSNGEGKKIMTGRTYNSIKKQHRNERK